MQRWQDLLSAQGGSDWVVLPGGATAVFHVTSIVEAARLAEALTHAPELMAPPNETVKSEIRLSRGFGETDGRFL